MIKKMILLMVALASIQSAAATNSSLTDVSPKAEINKKTFGFFIEPIWAISGGLGLGADFLIGNRFSIEISGVYLPKADRSDMYSNDDDPWETTSYNSEYSAIGLGSKIFLTGSHHRRGLYISPRVSYIQYKISEYGDFDLSASADAIRSELKVGYQWIWGNFRMAFGGGLASISGVDKIEVKDSDGDVIHKADLETGDLAIDAQFGFVF